MKIKSIIGLCTLSLVAVATLAGADELCQGEYRHSSETVTGYSSNTEHVVRDDCRDSYLAPTRKSSADTPLQPGAPLALDERIELATQAQAGLTAAAKENTIAGTIHFLKDSSLLTAAGKAEVEDVINKVLATGLKPVVSLTGYTCDLGSKRHNDRLARARAATVKKVLQERGIQVLKSGGEGKTGYITKDHSKRYLNRRVEAIRLNLMTEAGGRK